MESQTKAGSIGGMDGMSKGSGKERKLRGSELFIRILGFTLTLVGAVLLGVDNQNTVVPIDLLPNIPPVNVHVSAKFHYLSAFVYFVTANAIACSYGAISLIVLMKNKSAKKVLEPKIIVLDLVMVALLFSSNGAAMAIGLMGFKGNSHVRWDKVCNVFGKFCNQVAAAIAVSMLGSLAFLLLVAVAAVRLHGKSYK